MHAARLSFPMRHRIQQVKEADFWLTDRYVYNGLTCGQPQDAAHKHQTIAMAAQGFHLLSFDYLRTWKCLFRFFLNETDAHNKRTSACWRTRASHIDEKRYPMPQRDCCFDIKKLLSSATKSFECSRTSVLGARQDGGISFSQSK